MKERATPSDQKDVRAASELAGRLVQAISRAYLGRRETLDLVVACLLAQGHLLLEDVPGVGKTTLAQALAAAMEATFRRIQFTSDLLPADVLGVTVYDQRESRFRFVPGPVFANVVLADEINRASPRTQSALLEAMNEGQVSVDEETHPLPRPFFVVATQNPVEHFGTFPLPDSQMDRFAIRLALGYPDREQERRLVAAPNPEGEVAAVQSVVSVQEVREAQRAVYAIHVEDSLVSYVLDVVAATRDHPKLELGVSPRGARTWLHVARALAAVRGRTWCTPDDLRDTAGPALAHRLIPIQGVDESARARARDVLDEVLESVPVPT